MPDKDDLFEALYSLWPHDRRHHKSDCRWLYRKLLDAPAHTGRDAEYFMEASRKTFLTEDWRRDRRMGLKKFLSRRFEDVDQYVRRKCGSEQCGKEFLALEEERFCSQYCGDLQRKLDELRGKASVAVAEFRRVVKEDGR